MKKRKRVINIGYNVSDVKAISEIKNVLSVERAYEILKEEGNKIVVRKNKSFGKAVIFVKNKTVQIKSSFFHKSLSVDIGLVIMRTGIFRWLNN